MTRRRAGIVVAGVGLLCVVGYFAISWPLRTVIRRQASLEADRMRLTVEAVRRRGRQVGVDITLELQGGITEGHRLSPSRPAGHLPFTFQEKWTAVCTQLWDRDGKMLREARGPVTEFSVPFFVVKPTRVYTATVWLDAPDEGWFVTLEVGGPEGLRTNPLPLPPATR